MRASNFLAVIMIEKVERGRDGNVGASVGGECVNVLILLSHKIRGAPCASAVISERLSGGNSVSRDRREPRPIRNEGGARWKSDICRFCHGLPEAGTPENTGAARGIFARCAKEA